MDDIKVYRKLGALPAETAEYLLQFEGSHTLVENDRARDVAWTEDIIAATKSFALVRNGEVLLANIKTLQAAEDAKSRARVVTSIELAPEEEAAADGPEFPKVD